MKSITVREAQHNLAEVLRLVEGGSVVEIRRRNKPVARIVPSSNVEDIPSDVEWAGHRQCMKDIWGDTVIHDLDDVLQDLRGDA